MSGVRRWATRCLNAVSFLVGVPLLVFLLSWALTKDEPLHADVQALLAPIADTGERNGFYVYVGLTAPEGLDAHEAGRLAVAAVNKALLDPNWPAIESYSNFFAGGEVIALPAWNFCNTDSCIDASRINADNVAMIRAHPSFKTLNARYAQLLSAPTFTNTTAGSLRAPLPRASNWMLLSELRNAEHAERLGRGVPLAADSAEFMHDFLAWRRILAASNSLIISMTARRVLERKLQLLNQLLERNPALASSVSIAGALAPLTVDERSLAHAMRGEFSFVANATLEAARTADHRKTDEVSIIDRVFGRLLGNGYKCNTTVNRQYEQMLVRQAAFGSTAKLAAAGHAKSMSMPEPSMLAVFLTSPFTNPIGEVLLQVAVTDFGRYHLRVHDLDAQIRLTAARIRLIAEAVPADQVVGKLAEWAPTLSDPYTEAAFEYEAATKRIAATRGDGDSKSHLKKFYLPYPG